MNERKLFKDKSWNGNIKSNKEVKKTNDFKTIKNTILDSNNCHKAGITLIALVISIIVMLILAGVSLNATIGNNGIITQAQNATYMQSIAILEEYLQNQYVKYYDDTEKYTSKPELLNNKISNLLLKDGSRNYILKDGKVYYLVNKSSLPDEVKNNIKGGDTKEYSKYIRLIDVYGITSDLKVYYCGDENSSTVLGNLDVSDIDPNIPVNSINNDSAMKETITKALQDIGMTVDGEKGITVGNVSALNKLEINGNKSNISSIESLGELKNLRELTLKNISLENLNGLESLPNLYYIYLQNCKIGDYSKLSTVYGLEYLYIYLSYSMPKDIANEQVNLLGQGLSTGTNLNKLTYFGVCGTQRYYEVDGSFYFRIGLSGTEGANGKYTYTTDTRGNLTDISGLEKVNDTIKKSIKYMYLVANNIDSITSLKDYSSIYELALSNNVSLQNVSGLEGNNSIKYLTLNDCNVSTLSGLSQMGMLEHLAVQNNLNLTSLTGIENDTNLKYLLAYGCNIDNITALEKMNNLVYLDLHSNVNLNKVSVLGKCTNLKYLYLAENENMDAEQVRDALANTETHILQNCGNYYTIPNKYMIYFSNLTSYDYSYSTYGKLLTDDSDEIKALKNKNGIKKLILTGQKQLSNAKLQEILGSLTGLNQLNVSDIPNLTSIEFCANLKNLIELDLYNTNVTDLKALNSLKSLGGLRINNSSIDLTKIQTALQTMFNNGGEYYSDVLSIFKDGKGFQPFSDALLKSMEKCTEITNITLHTHVLSYNTNLQEWDLSKLTKLKSIKFCRGITCTIRLPENIEIVDALNDGKYSKFDYSLCKKINYINDWYSTLTNENIKNILQRNVLNTLVAFGLSYSNQLQANKLTTFEWLNTLQNSNVIKNIYCQSDSGRILAKDIGNYTMPDNVEKIAITDTYIYELPKFTENSKIKNINCSNNKISNLSNLKNIKNLEQLNLSRNNITDLSALKNLIDNGKTTLTTLNLSNNSLEATTTGGTSNIDILKELHSAGLKSINISGNKSITENEENIKQLKEIFGTGLVY